MSRNGSGVYSLPAGYEAVTGETATATQHNTPLEDLETDANTARPIVAGGTGSTTAAGARVNFGLTAGATAQGTLGFGTSCLVDTGTSGTKVPLLDGANTHSGANTFSSTVRLTVTTDVDLSSTGHAFQIGEDSGQNLAVDNNEIQSRNNGSASNLDLNAGGGTVICGGNITANSDERKKRNWQSLEPDFIKRLRNVKRGSYERIDIGIRQIGVGAQGLQKVIPEAVEVDKNGFLSVAYGQAALVIALELADIVSDLQEKMAEASK